MKLSALQTPAGRLIRTEADEVLDLRADGMLEDACRLAAYPDLSAIEVNLGRTRHIRGSGVKMLLMLHRRGSGLSKRVRLVNCREQIRRQLMESSVAGEFQVVQLERLLEAS